MARSERLSILVHSPYRKGKPSGVNSFIEEGIPHFERLGCEVKTVRPAPLWYPLERKDDSDYHLGRGVKAPVASTDFEIGFAFSKRKARDILEDARPHLVVCHQPAIPFSAHTLISANPIVNGEKRLVPFVAQFHAGPPPGGVERITEIATEVLARIRRVRFKQFLPRGFTLGWVQTLKRGFSGWISVSEGTANFWYPYTGHEQRVIYNGIDASLFTPEGETLEEWKRQGGKVILTAARHDSRKGLIDLLRAYDLVGKEGYDVRLKLAGEGEMTPKLKEVVEREDIPNVEFLGVVSKHDLAKAYRTADLVVAPSTGGEGFNRTIAEGRMSGTLVVCTDIEGQNEAIGDDLHAFMAKPQNPEDLKDQIIKILDLPRQYAQELRTKSREDAVRRFRWETIVAQHVSYYDEVLSAHGELPVWKGSTRTFLSRIPVAGDVFVGDHPNRYQKAG